jgi:phosphatidate cytidylyltransferase
LYLLPFSFAVLGIILMSALANILAQLGDLSESLIKRSAGAKDSGSLFPGHGGILDRLDAFLFSTPFVFYYRIFLIE